MSNLRFDVARGQMRRYSDGTEVRIVEPTDAEMAVAMEKVKQAYGLSEDVASQKGAYVSHKVDSSSLVNHNAPEAVCRCGNNDNGMGYTYHSPAKCSFDPLPSFVTPEAGECRTCQERDGQATIDTDGNGGTHDYSTSGACKECGMVLVPSGPAPFQQSECSALRGTLPKSERFIEESCATFEEQNAVRHAAVNDLRRKVSTLREWPVCPVSKQELVIKTKVQTDEKDHLGRDMGSKRWEYIHTWQAEFVCPPCKDGK